MKKDRVSIVIPARNDIHVAQTVNNFLMHAKGEVDCTVFLDGWNIESTGKIPQTTIDRLSQELDCLSHLAAKDSRIKIIKQLEPPVGQRIAINRMVREAEGEFFLKIDGHCIASEAWDVEFKKVVEDDTLLVPAMRGIEEVSWTVNDKVYTHASIDRSVTWKWWPEYNHRASEPVMDTMAFPGTVCFGSTALWPKIGGHNETWAPWGDCGTELSLKTWLTGHRLLLVHNVCIAHLFRKVFPYHMSGGRRRQTRRAIRRDVLEGKLPGQRHAVQWLVGKFDPVPSWESKSLLEYTDKFNDR